MYIFVENGTMFRGFLWKSDPLELHIPVCLDMWVPPPPPGHSISDSKNDGIPGMIRWTF